jgi:hypothetical protein
MLLRQSDVGKHLILPHKPQEEDDDEEQWFQHTIGFPSAWELSKLQVQKVSSSFVPRVW